MKKLLNTLFITSEDAYAALDGENIVIRRGDAVVGRFPLHTLQGIISFSYAGASPALMGACAERDVSLAFCSPRGRFLARVCGENQGNVLLRRAQYRKADDPSERLLIARNFIFGKISNGRWSMERTRRDHRPRIDEEAFSTASAQTKALLNQVLEVSDLDALRGIEGSAASIYFGRFDDMILGNKEDFFFHGRSRRPPMDRVNALLSFVYTLLSNDCASALESVGLDAWVGFMHTDRPGRASLALDLMEELRPALADRFVLTLLNNRILDARPFERQGNGAVLLTPDGRKTVLAHWQKRKAEELVHPYLGEKLAWGMIPYAQALLLARTIRGDLEEYPPFLWK